jgi:23S rRNA (uracil1939-C5)-methyltransferase
MEPIMGMEDPWRYRNKAQYPIGFSKKDGKIVAGYYAGRTHSIIDVRDCLLSPEHNADILRAVVAFAETYRIEPYDETTGKGLLRHLLVREGFASGQVLVCLVINGKKLPHAAELVERLLKISKTMQADIKSICLNVNRQRTNVILGDKVIPLYGDPWITDYLGDFSFRISPLSFYQVNPAQTVKLYNTAIEFAQLTGRETVFDLFCGIGTISHFLARAAKEVYGVEVVLQAIEDAKANAVRNGVTNAKFFAAAAEDVAERGYFDEENPLVRPDVVLVDPPRKGCEESLLRTIRKLGPDRVVYVSCDSATLARDLKILCESESEIESGYSLERVRACDMFPHATHVETVCLLSKLSEVKNHISVKVDMNEMDLTAAESKATYQEIKEWVKEKYGFQVSHLNIAKTKRKCGIIERQNYNLPKSEDGRSPETPKEKEEAIIAAFKAFRMI